jgi:hypothetical protein
MKAKLLAAHVIADVWQPRGAILELPEGYPPTPLMEGLDEEATAAIEYAKVKAFGRYPWPYGLYPPRGVPLDNPPIPRPLDDNQPVFHYTGRPEYL